MRRFHLCLLLLVFSVSPAHAQNPGPDSIYYQKRTRFIGYPPYPLKADERSRLTDIRDLRQAWRIIGYGHDNITPAEAKQKAEEFKAQGFNLVMFEGNRYLFRGQRTLKASSVFHVAPFEELIKNVKVASDACHKAGLKFFLHQTCTMVDETLLQEHPDWQAIDMATGKTITNGYGTSNSCINNDDFMNAFFARLERLIAETKPDGIMQDEIQFFSPTLCGCHWCREKFKKETGFTMPEKPDGWAWHPEIPSYLAWLEWHRAKVVQNLQKVRALIKKPNANNTVICYLCDNSAAYAWYSAGLVIDDFPQYSDSVGLECEPPDMLYQYYWPLTIYEMKYLRAVAENIGCAPWTLFYDRTLGDYTWNWFLSMSQGQRVWWFDGDPAATPSWEPLVAWEEKHEKILMNVQSAANVGVLFSEAARDRTPKTWSRMSWMDGFAAACNALTDNHVAYKVLVDADMTAETLKRKVKTLVLFDTGVMSDAAAEAVRQFVKDGGILIAGGSTSLYDSECRQRKDFALASLYGCSLAGECTDTNTLDIPAANDVTGPITGSLPHNFPFYLLQTTAPDVKTVAWMTVAGGKKYPGILVRNVGKGKVVYFAGHPAFHYFSFYYNTNEVKPGEFWTDHRDPKYGRLLARCVTFGNDALALVATNLPAGVVSEAYRHQAGNLKGIEVHLANFLGGRVKTGMVPKVSDISFPEVKPHLTDPAKPITLTVRADGVRNVYLLSPDFDATVELPFTSRSSFCTVNLPVLYRYAIVYFSQGDNKDIVNLNGGKAVKAVPAAKKLKIEENPPLVGTYDPEATVVFADTKDFKGGADIGYIKREAGRFLYGDMSDVQTATVTLNVAKKPAHPILDIGGMDDNQPASKAPLKIELNGKTIFEGKSTYPDQEWAVQAFPIDPAALRVGVNTVRITNTGHGPRSSCPWFGVSFVRIRNAK